MLPQKCIYCVNPMSRSRTGRRIKVLKSSDTTYEVDSAVRIRLTHIWCASSRSNDWCCVIAFQFFFFWGTGYTLFNWHLHDFLSALDTKFLPIFETLVSHSRKTFVITRNNAITFFLCIFNGPQPHLLILALSMVLTQLNMWCANLFDMIVWPD